MDANPYAPDDPRATARERFAEMIRLTRGDPPLVETALVIALEECPELPVRNYLARLHAFSSVIADRVRDAAAASPAGRVSVPDRIRILNDYVFGDLGFRGNREAYYDPRNSLLHEVIDRRLGIPVTLSLVYMELAKGAGLHLAGVGLPGHFLVKTLGVHPTHLLDPFNAGAELGPEQIDERLRALGDADPDETLRALRAVDNRTILRRLLNNLKVVYLRRGELDAALRAQERLLILAPESADELRELGHLYGRMGRYPEGVALLEQCREQAEGEEERDRLDAEVEQLRYWFSRLN